MTVLTRATIKIRYSGAVLARDVTENTFWFQRAEIDDAAELTAIGTALQGFYGFVEPTTSISIQTVLAPYVDLAAARIILSNVDVTTGIQVGTSFDEPFTFTGDTTAVDTAGLPAEVACCASFANTAFPSDLPKARRRGRVYIGPLCAASHVVSTGEYSRPNHVLQECLVGAMSEIPAALTISGAVVVWGVYSRPVTIAQAAEVAEDHPSTTVTARSGQFSQVDYIWCDNEWDTQRRRGQDPTSRVDAHL